MNPLQELHRHIDPWVNVSELSEYRPLLTESGCFICWLCILTYGPCISKTLTAAHSLENIGLYNRLIAAMGFSKPPAIGVLASEISSKDICIILKLFLPIPEQHIVRWSELNLALCMCLHTYLYVCMCALFWTGSVGSELTDERHFSCGRFSGAPESARCY